VLRLVASGVASLADFDLAAVEEVRVAVDELGATLIGASTGGPIELTFHLADGTLHVEGSTVLGDGAELTVDPLTDRILDVVATRHEWSSEGGVARGRIEKAGNTVAVS
jgi:serine/threonine-protein kinase RsbW